MITLHELLEINPNNFCDFKVHFATGSEGNDVPYNAFLVDEFKEWQEHQTNRNFGRQYILSLIYYDKDIWMFAGIYEVLSVDKIANSDDWKYKTVLINKASDYIGRAFFKFKKEFRASYPTLELEPKNGVPIAKIQLAYILDKRVALEDFVGFDRVNIDYKTLKHIINDNLASWKSALSNIKGVYLIVDTKTGKQYVGSAYGEDCIWQRWSDYAKDGHGNNKALKALLKQFGSNYCYYFKYSILEVCNINLGNEYIINRENYWKDVLLTRKFGLNEN